MYLRVPHPSRFPAISAPSRCFFGMNGGLLPSGISVSLLFLFSLCSLCSSLCDLCVMVPLALLCNRCALRASVAAFLFAFLLAFLLAFPFNFQLLTFNFQPPQTHHSPIKMPPLNFYRIPLYRRLALPAPRRQAFIANAPNL